MGVTFSHRILTAKVRTKKKIGVVVRRFSNRLLKKDLLLPDIAE